VPSTPTEPAAFQRSILPGMTFFTLVCALHFVPHFALSNVKQEDGEDSIKIGGIVSDCQEAEGLFFVQSIRERRRQVEDAPFASLVGESSQESPSGIKTVLQIQKVMALAQTKVQTKVGEAPYFIIAVAVAGFTLSLLSICVSLIFVKGVAQDTRREGLPNASALLQHRLRAMGIGQPKWHQNHHDVAPSKTWHFPAQDRAGHVQIVVHQPLEGGKVGLNLSEDDLVVNNFGDFRACDFGFQIGDRIVQVNAIPVFKESDFRFVMQDALRRHEDSGEPILFEVIRAPKPMAMPAGCDAYPATSPAVMRTMLPKHPDFEDITGEWCYGKTGDADRFSYSVRKVGEALSFEQVLPNGQKVAGMLTPEDPQSPWLRSELRSSQGLFGELRIHFDPDEQVLVSQVRPAGRQKWGDERVAKRVARE